MCGHAEPLLDFDPSSEAPVGSLYHTPYVHTSDAAAALACSWRTVAGTVPVQSFDKRPFYYVDDVEVTYFEYFYVCIELVLVLRSLLGVQKNRVSKKMLYNTPVHNTSTPVQLY